MLGTEICRCEYSPTILYSKSTILSKNILRISHHSYIIIVTQQTYIRGTQPVHCTLTVPSADALMM